MVTPRKAEGFLNVLKPRGMTSHAVVSQIRRLFHCREVGHLGTLDPDAQGVLPIAVGRYTKLIPWVGLTPKIYRGWMILGVGTSSGDAQGQVTSQSGPPWPTRHDIHQQARWLVGTRIQIPPRVSAIQQDGQRLYANARKGIAVWPAPRTVVVDALTLIAGSGQEWQFEASVGTGTYIRALVRDWGFLLGHSAHLERLERIQVGHFLEDQAWTLEALHSLGSRNVEALNSWSKFLNMPQKDVAPDFRNAIRHGRQDVLDHLPGLPNSLVALSIDGDIMAIVDGTRKRYIKVLIKDESHAPD